MNSGNGIQLFTPTQTPINPQVSTPQSPYLTRYQARLAHAQGVSMANATGHQLLSELEPANDQQDQPSPRLDRQDDIDLGYDGSESSSGSGSGSDTESMTSVSDTESYHMSECEVSSEEMDIEIIIDNDDSVSSNIEGVEEAVADDGSAETETEEDDTTREIVRFDIGEILSQLFGHALGNHAFNGVKDKRSFFDSIGFKSDPDSAIAMPSTSHALIDPKAERAEKMWREFKDFNLGQFDLVRGLENFDISEIMTRVHMDPRIDSAAKKKILNRCSDLRETIDEFKEAGQKFDARIMMIMDTEHNPADFLPMSAGEIASGVAEIKETQKALQAEGFSLNLPDLELAMKSGLQVQNKGVSKVTFEDVVGIDEAKAELFEIVSYLRNPDKFVALGARVPKGVLLSGPPGTGKTLLAKAVAGEAGVPFVSVSGSAFVEEYVGVGAKRVRELFQQANAHDKCIIFIDELDAVGGHRNARNDGGGQEHDQTLNQLLTEMDGFGGRNGVIVMGATNRPDILDSALKRPGRFDRNIAIPLPTVTGREAILRLHGQKRSFEPDINFNAIARRTTGFSGAELENLINEAALLAGRANKTTIDQKDLESAHDKLIMGVEVPSFHMSEKNRLNTAYHEAGHAIVSYLLEEHDDVYKVTIMPRGNSLGATHYLPDEDDTSISFRKLKGQLCSLMGGRVAERILLGPEGVTTGASNDLTRASQLARRMVTEWGFSAKLGPVSFRESDGRFARTSTRTAELIDDDVRELILEAETSALDVLTKNRDKLDIMAQQLLEKETIDQTDVHQIMNNPASFL